MKVMTVQNNVAGLTSRCRRGVRRLVVLWGCGWIASTGVVASWATDQFAIDEAEATVITSERLTFDQGEQMALFEGNVVVRDPSMRMRADRLTVRFDARNQAEMIEAEGRVIIQQEETTAWAQNASYEVESGRIFLEGQPRIRRGRDILEGDTITFWRDTNKMICEPRARLVLFPEGEGPRGLFIGD